MLSVHVHSYLIPCLGRRLSQALARYPCRNVKRWFADTWGTHLFYNLNTGTVPLHSPLPLSSQYPSFPVRSFQIASSCPMPPPPSVSTLANHRGLHVSPFSSISLLLC